MTSVVWITGASRGIGRALVESVPWAPASIYGVSRDLKTSPSLQAGQSYEHVTTDLSDQTSWTTVREAITGSLDRSDLRRAVMVHCAGTSLPIGFAGEVDTIAYERAVLLNSVAPQVLGEAFLQALAVLDVDRPASLVFMSSGTAGSYPGWSSYKSGKAAIDGWVRAVASEQERPGGRRVRVLSVAPGVVDTSMQEVVRSSSDRDLPGVERFRELHRQGRLSTTEDVADSIWNLLESDGPMDPVVDLRERDEPGQSPEGQDTSIGRADG